MARGAFPDSHPQHLGMPGMHGTVARGHRAAEVRPAHRPRRPLRRPGHRQAVDLRAGRQGHPRRHRPGRDRQEPRRRRADRGRRREVIADLIVAREGRARRRQPAPTSTAWWRQLDHWRDRYPLGYDDAGRRHAAPQYVIERLGKIAGPDAIYVAGVGQHQMWAAQFIAYEKPRTWLNSGGVGTMGYAVPAAMGAKVGRPDATVWAIDGDGCFQMTNQELATCAIEGIPIKVAIINNGSLGMVRQWQTLFYNERYSNTDLHSQPDPGLREAGRGDGLRRAALRECGRRRRDDREGDGDQRRPVVIDFVVHKDAMVWPMVAAGTSNDDIMVARDARARSGTERNSEVDDQAHAVRPGREQARRARPDRRPVLAARLQHRLARGRADRAPRRLPHDDRRQRRGPAARAGHQAAQQAGQRAQDRRARAGLVGAARAAAGQGAAPTRRPGRTSSRPCSCSAPRSSTSPRRRHDRGHRQRRQARGAAAGARAVRHQGARAVRAWSRSAAVPRSITDRSLRTVERSA